MVSYTLSMPIPDKVRAYPEKLPQNTQYESLHLKIPNNQRVSDYENNPESY